MDNFMGFLGAYYVVPFLIIGLIGFALGWFLKPSKKVAGDLSVEGEGALRAEADTLRSRVQDLEARIAGQNDEVSALKGQLVDAPSVDGDLTTKTTEADESYALEWQNRYLAARVKYLDSRLADLGTTDDAKPAAKARTAAKKVPAVKKAPAKKPAATTSKTVATAAAAAAITTAKATKKAPAKKPAAAKTATATKKAAPAKKATAKKTATKTASTAAKKAPAKKKPAAKSDAKLDKYFENVKKYDAKASKTVVENIVKYCGISLRSRDSSLVACSDEAELQTVAKGFVTKKLGVSDGQMDVVKSICEEMKSQRMKSRVTFYYLAAKKVNKLGVFK
jgi:cell division protein FtsB